MRKKKKIIDDSPLAISPTMKEDLAIEEEKRNDSPLFFSNLDESEDNDDENCSMFFNGDE